MTPIQFHTNQLPTIRSKARENGKAEEMHVYDCPFCGKDQHLYYFPENTAWTCHVCGKKGNVYIFIQLLYSEVCNHKIDDLIKAWDMPKRVFEKIKYNPLNETYIIPTFRNGRLNNLYKYVEYTNKIICTPGLGLTLFDWEDESHEEVWLCEGQKDTLAANAIIGLGREITPIGIPGATTFKTSWVNALQGKKLLLIFDNDNAGKEGRKKTLKIIEEAPVKPQTIHEVIWPDHSPDGFDLRDFYNENRGRSWQDLQHLIHPITDEKLTRVTTETVIGDFNCDSYNKAVDMFATAYHMTPDMTAVLALVMASIYSIKIEGEQLWLKVVGPPGCGKTRIAKAVSASDYVVSRSTFKGLFSGFKDNEDKDPGLIPEITGRTLVIKDADALLRQPNIEQIMSELRDFYDKDSSVSYRNRISYNYQNIKSTFVMMGTQVLRRADQSFLGERLLTIEMDVSPQDQMAINTMQMERSLAVALGEREDPEIAIMASMKGWLDHLRERELDSTLPQEFKDEVIRLCSLTALLRTQVDRNFRGRIQSPAVPELPTRLIGQIVTAALSLSVVFGVNKPDESIYQIVKKVLKDTMNPRSHRFIICDVILETPRIRGHEIMEATGLDKHTVGEEIKDLLELNFIQSVKVDGSAPGHKVAGFVLVDQISSPFKEVIA